MSAPDGYTREYIKRRNFDWMNQHKLHFKTTKTPKITKTEKGIIQNINDVVRVSHQQFPPQPRSISTILAGRPKPTLAAEISAGLLDQTIQIAQYDKLTGNVIKDPYGKILYKKEKLKDILYKPVGELIRINKTLTSNIPALTKVANVLIGNRIKEKQSSQKGYDENSLLQEFRAQGITAKDLKAIDNITGLLS